MKLPLKQIVIFVLLLAIIFYLYNLIESSGKESLLNAINIIVKLLWGITILTVVLVLIMENRSPTKTLSWILILFFLPILGFIIYLVFGRNFRKKKIYARKEYNDYDKLKKIERSKLDHRYDISILGKERPAVSLISRLLENNNKAFLTYHNRGEIFSDGKQAIEAIFSAIESAQKTIHLQFFIIRSDRIGNSMKDLLIKKAREGVKVRLLYDSVGSWNIGCKYVRALQKGGVETSSFSPVSFPYISSKMNYRNHRKIAIIDGNIGFLGGVNIADRYMHKDKYYGFWRDTHIRIEGEAVHPLQAIFLNDWTFATGDNQFKDENFPESDIENINPIQIISSGPDSDWESIMQGYFAMITLASKNINIVTPYLILNESMLTAIKVSALSGVRVRLIVPSKPDHHLVFWAARSYFQDLLEAGIKIYEYRKGFIHSKYITVDGHLASIGSANMDIRSFLHNLEVNAFLFSDDLTARLDRIFEEDLDDSTELTLDEHLDRSYFNRFKESLARLFSPIL